MPGEDFDALLRASRWTAASPFLDPDSSGPLERLPISSPFHGAVQVEDFQLVPLLKALRMPRVNLLIADDVGLGKTIEAGLILSELLLRRRIQRVLILTPASLRLQWRDEMWDKFALPFDLVDRAETHALRQRLGMDANPWRSFSRIIASYHYLRQDDVLEQFMAACRTPEGSPHLPWDLLIVDECHNLMPSAFGDDSDLCRMLRLIAPQFEHRLFLSATPHNGHTRCFTGLLEILDPVRFSSDGRAEAGREGTRPAGGAAPPEARDQRAHSRRRSSAPGMPPQAQVARAVPQGGRAERRVRLRSAPRCASSWPAASAAVDVQASFAVEILGKRLLSCPTAFAESWRRCKEGLAERCRCDRGRRECRPAQRSSERPATTERRRRAKATAAGVVGAWLKNVAAT